MKINWKYEIKQYGTALIIAGTVFLSLSVYIYFRRGYYSLYIANKAFAGAAASSLGLDLLIGAFSRAFPGRANFLQYRKELGVVAFFLALVHGIVSLFLLQDYFNMAYYLGWINWPFIYGLTALLVLFIILLISNQKATQKLGVKRWWQWQNWGARIGFLLVLFHVVVMKWRSWLLWYKRGGGPELTRPDWPGGGILVGWLMLFVVLVRLGELFFPLRRRQIWQVLGLGLIVTYGVTFWWGRQVFYGSN
jgi:DMSO/TMAO reductase YedYZ heme-binding membrane subunit